MYLITRSYARLHAILSDIPTETQQTRLKLHHTVTSTFSLSSPVISSYKTSITDAQISR